jgi:hypothetical protein
MKAYSPYPAGYGAVYLFYFRTMKYLAVFILNCYLLNLLNCQKITSTAKKRLI